MRKTVPVTALVAFGGFFLAATAADAQMTGDAMRGAALAESWCSSCHVIDLKGTGKSVDMAPPFPQVANDPKMTPDFLQSWLVSSHPQMPKFDLGRREIDDLIAYIETLKTKR